MKEQIQNRVDEVLMQALDLGFDVSDCEVGFFRQKRALGLAYRNKQRIEFNLDAAEIQGIEDYTQTIKHEIAHLIQFKYYPYAKQAHGPEFKRILATLGGVPSTHAVMSAEQSAAFRSTRKYIEARFDYACSCNTFKISKRMHNQILKGQTRSCVRCREVIKLVK